ncbi:SDR family oxidoreductase [Shewanella sp.]|uniref:SDR family oxidoreductase n=1 Tax=Shewanella sp. TaxID=50422 RepID=UPI003562E3DF
MALAQTADKEATQHSHQHQTRSSSQQQHWALVTGGARRIGAAICKRLHCDGFNILIHCHHSKAEADSLALELNLLRPNSAVVLQAELGSEPGLKILVDGVTQMLGEKGGILTALVNNASVFAPEDAADIDADFQGPAFDAMASVLQVNALTPYLLTKRLYSQLAIKGGAVVNLCDIHGRRPLKRHGVYSMSKAALEMATLSLAQELAPKVRVNGVAPGAILWPESPDSNADAVVKQIPLGRAGEPEDIATTVSFLVKADYISGQIIAVDGGRSASGFLGAIT